jgi:hypothetical protein
LTYRIDLEPAISAELQGFNPPLLRLWDRSLEWIAADPLPRVEDRFSISATVNAFGDEFVSFVFDELPFAIQYDVYA